MKFKKHSALMLACTAWIHTIVGIIVYWQQIIDIANDGVINAVKPQLYANRAAAFWFFLFGVLMFMIAQLMNWLIRNKGIDIPKFVGIHLLVISLIGVCLLPVSGFWLIIPQAIIILRK